jgi:hypothetical protein
MTLEKVDIGDSFDKDNYYWRTEAIRSSSELARLEEETGLKIALAVRYIEYGFVRSIRIVTKDRQHYQTHYKKGEYKL